MAWSALIPVIAALAGGMFGGSRSSSTSVSGNTELDPQIQEILNEQRMRMRLQNPLYEETQQLMRSLMPKGARPTSYVLPGTVSPTPRRIPTEDRERPEPQIPPRGETPDRGYDGMSQAVRLMASGISPIQQAKLFRR